MTVVLPLPSTSVLYFGVGGGASAKDMFTVSQIPEVKSPVSSYGTRPLLGKQSAGIDRRRFLRKK